MRTMESGYKKDLYVSPAAMVIVIASESVLCGSTEGYGVNKDYSLTDEDFE